MKNTADPRAGGASRPRVRPLFNRDCAALLLVYLAAGAISFAAGDFVALPRFLYFAATAVFVVIAHRNKSNAPTAAS